MKRFDPVSHYHGGMKQTVDGPYVLYAEIEEKNQRIKKLTEFSSLCVFVLRDLISHTSMGETKDFVYPRWVWEKVKEVLEEADHESS